jgi:GrpB-like predicted nucleotidyltransferase (UPF0157 family)
MSQAHFVLVHHVIKTAQVVFGEEKDRIRRLIPHADIKHVGSTAVPGALTKGDLDLQVRVRAEDFASARDILQTHYRIHQPEKWTSTFASFMDPDENRIPTGIQLTAMDSDADFFFRARDLLVNSPIWLCRYYSLKELYEGKSMDAYREEKGRFFENLHQAATEEKPIERGGIGGRAPWSICP